MITHASTPCATSTRRGLERTRFFGHQLVGPEDLTQDQDYFREKLRRHNRMMHGWGVVCGACVRRGQDACEVVIEPGYILSPQGDEIVIEEPHVLDLCHMDRDGACGCCGDTTTDPWCADDRQPCTPGVYFLAIRYTECLSKPVRQPAGGCAPTCEGECEYSRIREGYELTLLTELPDGYTSPLRAPSPSVLLPCQGNTPRPCPPCAPSPWVILADIQVGDDCGVRGVDCFRHRRYAVTSAPHFQVCAREQKYPSTHTYEGGVMDYVRYMASTSGSKALADVAGSTSGTEPRASVMLVRGDGSAATLPGYFEVEAGDTMGTLLAREENRLFVDPVSGAEFTLGELTSAAGVDLDMEVRSTGHALSTLEGLRVDFPALRDTADVVASTLGEEGMVRLRNDYGGRLEGVVRLPGSSITGVEEDTRVGRKLGRVTVGEIAEADKEAFVAGIVRGLPRADLETNRALAERVWERAATLADRTRNLVRRMEP